jgi:hypothetical protein
VYNAGGHLELWQGNRVLMNCNGAQRACQLRPRCVGAVRSRTQSQINQSVLRNSMSGLVTNPILRSRFFVPCCVQPPALSHTGRIVLCNCHLVEIVLFPHE